MMTSKNMYLPPHLTAKQIAEFTSLSKRKVYVLMSTNPDFGGIPSFKVGPKSVLADREDFLQWWEKTKREGKLFPPERS
ncbi:MULTISPECIES: helix-turn-helix domain-containing protein [unclassified Paenibacillus]|uniref:helix-turn-helix transcriptional regulator n=1 Tax=unclassified Paenibacillus TaxID=185978 RepID=UPI0024760760|nr:MULTISPECIES: helix-turn-helix domain-containing protein [unclassified Paenibacillus]MDH6430246.1 excisionase family DNA binding protein [Paenibacillus sp. PastH-4]MDH6446461.1 excisionase family DNA binding protein [Paenibacillus sp. PastF-4]MDH6530073.1 excisionase family DNA binding protein [Paenibacillus sp. PastH-3]